MQRHAPSRPARVAARKPRTFHLETTLKADKAKKRFHASACADSRLKMQRYTSATCPLLSFSRTPRFSDRETISGRHPLLPREAGNGDSAFRLSEAKKQ